MLVNPIILAFKNNEDFRGKNTMGRKGAVLLKIIGFIDSFTEFTGRTIAWLTLAMMLTISLVVVLRYLLGAGSIAFQESVTYLHAVVFMLGIAFTLKRDAHVRVDIFYRRFSRRSQLIVDFLGGLLFLLPVCMLIFVFSWDYVMNSWAIAESSSEPSGLPWVYLLKTLLLIMPATLFLQGVAETLRNLLELIGSSGGQHAPHDEREVML